MRVGKAEIKYWTDMTEDTRESLELAELRKDQGGIDYYKGRLSILERLMIQIYENN